MLLENERLDEVNDRLRLIQRTDGITFGTDALLLAGYIGRGYRDALELGTGTGILSLLLLAREKAERITALEVQDDYAALAQRNAALNSLETRLTVLSCDVRDYAPSPDAACDLVFTNPPYMKRGTGYENPTDLKNIARREVCGTISDFLCTAGRALRYGGSFVAVYRPDRLTDLICAMREVGIEPKRLTAVHADAKAPVSLLLIEGRRGGGVGLYLTPPLLLYRDGEHKTYSAEMEEILETGFFPAKYYRNK